MSTHGLDKDVVMLGGYQTLDFTADQPGLPVAGHRQRPFGPRTIRTATATTA
ncbi:hypothetical protein [Streptomyces atratus]|uniref:hypothetical protein n=1 Tax=Streptomyces atratus TaxID=1893 RepID=UPI0033DF41ED